LKSQIAISSLQAAVFLKGNRSQFATGSHVVHSRRQALTGYRRREGTAEMNSTLTNEKLEPLIFVIRGCRVVLDADLARIYGATTKAFNQAFKRNQPRFPADFAFQLTESEFENLRSQLGQSNPQAIDSHMSNWSQTVTSSEGANSSQFVMSSSRHRGVAYRPWAFTEHGALMAANILRSERAVQMSVFVVRAFIRLREEVVANTRVVARLAEIDKKLLQHDVALLDLYEKLEPLLQPPADPPKRRIGFHTDDE
jgi:hypothetical protein